MSDIGAEVYLVHNYVVESLIVNVDRTLVNLELQFDRLQCKMEGLPVVAQRSPPQGTGPLDPQGIESPHPQGTAHEDPLGTRTLDLQAREHPHINLGSRQSHAQATGNAQSQGTGIPNLQGTAAPQAHGTESLDPHTTRHPGLATTHTEASCLLKDAITRDLMCDPVKCNDGRTYDRWTVVDRGITGSEPFARRPTLSIVVDDLSVRDVLFRAFPEQKDKFLSKRMAYRRIALQLPRLHPAGVEVAIEMLHNVLQWAPEDTICRDELKEVNVIFSEIRRQSDSDSEESGEE